MTINHVLLLHPKHPQHLIPVVVDHLDGDLAGVGPVKRAALG